MFARMEQDTKRLEAVAKRITGFDVLSNPQRLFVREGEIVALGACLTWPLARSDQATHVQRQTGTTSLVPLQRLAGLDLHERRFGNLQILWAHGHQSH